jgi:hypothetical protein
VEFGRGGICGGDSVRKASLALVSLAMCVMLMSCKGMDTVKTTGLIHESVGETLIYVGDQVRELKSQNKITQETYDQIKSPYNDALRCYKAASKLFISSLDMTDTVEKQHTLEDYRTLVLQAKQSLDVIVKLLESFGIKLEIKI